LSVLVRSVSGIRGIVGEGMDPSLVLSYAAAFGTFSGRGTVVLGRDSRPSGETLAHAAIAGLAGVGCRVIDLGISATPTVQLMVGELGAAGGIVVTASHNPAEWNALKFIGPRSVFLSRRESEAFWKELSRPDRGFRRHDGLGAMERFQGAEKIHVEKTLGLSVVDVDRVRSSGFRVVLDAVNGAGGKLCSGLLESLGCEVIGLNLEPSGEFGRKPEPIPENLDAIARAVAREGAHVGFALDPDGDRLALVSEKGHAVGEEYTLALALKSVLRKTPGPVVMNMSTSLVSEEVARAAGCPVFRSRVGEANVVELMIERDSPVGGEGNGGVILRELHLGRDAAAGIGLVLTLLAEEGVPLSEIVESLPRFYMLKEKIAVERPEESLEKLRSLAELFDGLDEADGLKFKNAREWLHVRKSGTEPVVRIIAESESGERTRELMDLAKARLVS